MAADLSALEARRLHLAAQGFADPLPVKVTKRHLHRVIARTGVLQLDSVNIVARPQYVVPYSRLGPYDARLLDEIAYRDRAWFECNAHAACLVPVERYPLLRPRMDGFRDGTHINQNATKWDEYLRRYLEENRPYMDAVLSEIAERGALSAGELSDGGKSQPGVMWGWSRGKHAVEMLFRTGEVAALRRLPSFERVYDLPERVIAKAALDAPVPEHDEAERRLVELAARSLGVGTAKDLSDYYRVRADHTKRRADELVETRVLERVSVEGWREPAYTVAGARVPRRIERAALLTPFDPLVWDRKRALRMFGFDYKIEIYVPAPKRKYGYYVFPFLNGDRIVARVDLKADRKAGVLRVLGAWPEAGIAPDDVTALDEELTRFALFLGLDRVGFARRGLLHSLRRV
jgi:uncharacterized protein YcaQ